MMQGDKKVTQKDDLVIRFAGDIVGNLVFRCLRLNGQ